MEKGVDKCRDTLYDEVIGRNNGIPRILGFMDFGAEVERGGCMVGNMEGDVLGGNTLEGARKKDEKGLLISISRIVREKRV